MVLAPASVAAAVESTEAAATEEEELLAAAPACPPVAVRKARVLLMVSGARATFTPNTIPRIRIAWIPTGVTLTPRTLLTGR